MTDLVQHTHLIKKCHLVPLTLVTHLQMVWHLLVHIARCHNNLHYTLLSVYNLITKILHVLCQPICLNYTSWLLNTCNVCKSNTVTESPILRDQKNIPISLSKYMRIVLGDHFNKKISCTNTCDLLMHKSTIVNTVLIIWG